MSQSLSALVRESREAAGLTRLGLARHAGLSHPHIVSIEQGITRDPRASTVVALARGLGVTTDQILASVK